jgi:hypothetical protein
MTQVKHITKPFSPLPNSFHHLEDKGIFTVAKDGFTLKSRQIIPKEPDMLVREGRSWDASDVCFQPPSTKGAQPKR